MSISDQIKGLVQQGKLLEIGRRRLTDTGDPDKYRRSLFIGVALNSEMASRSDEASFRRLSVLWQTFTSGDNIPVALERDHKKAQWARLEPAHYEVWETRVRHRDPELRILGRFAACDVFIALNLYEGWELRRPKEWNSAIERCQSDWAALFPTWPPVVGSITSDYISANFTLI